MKTKSVLLISGGILLIILLILFNMYVYGFISFLNAPLNNLLYGPIDKTCEIDSDCAMRKNTCSVSCACPVPANKNWQRKCWFGYKYPTAMCGACMFGEAKCINGTCELVRRQL